MSRKYHYLYVEDDPLSREIMKTLLVDLVAVGSLVVFEDSRSFMDRLTALEPPPDFVLLDINIGPQNGYALMEAIRNHPATQHLTVLAVTASVMSKEIEAMKHAGFNGAIAKPLDMATFPDLIARLEAGEVIWQTN